MATSMDALKVRGRLGRKEWQPPIPYGPDGWRFLRFDQTAEILVSCADHGDGIEWLHASIARLSMPDYEDLTLLHRAVWGDTGYAYQLFVPVASHVNINEHVLHLWGRLDGAPVMPDFGAVLGSI